MISLCNFVDNLIKAVRAGSKTGYAPLRDDQIMTQFVSNRDLQLFVRRVTVGAQKTFTIVQDVIEELKGEAGLDENGFSLFTSNEDIDHVWALQQKHLECIQVSFPQHVCHELYMHFLAHVAT